MREKPSLVSKRSRVVKNYAALLLMPAGLTFAGGLLSPYLSLILFLILALPFASLFLLASIVWLRRPRKQTYETNDWLRGLGIVFAGSLLGFLAVLATGWKVAV